MVAHTRAPSGPHRLRPVADSLVGAGPDHRAASNALSTMGPAPAEPSNNHDNPDAGRPSVREVEESPRRRESSERSTKPASNEIHPPYPTSNSNGRSSEKGRLRALNLPRALHVEETECRPTHVQATAGLQEIDSIRERWRIDDEWWRRPISRMYYQVLLTGGDQLTIFKDLETGQWFQQQY